MGLVRLLRRGLRQLDKALKKLDTPVIPVVPRPPADRMEEVKAFLRSLDVAGEGAHTYLETHLHRIALTMTMVPPPGATGRALDLGTFMQMPPVLACVFGYREVRGAYWGPLGRIDDKIVTAGGREIFRCQVDHFDAERDDFPYPDGAFDLVLCCEMIEHLLHDPMRMMLEIRRVLADGGRLILTTPNVVSFTAVARVLHARENPQLFSMYTDPRKPSGETEVPHVREYTPAELEEVLRSAGFAVEYLFTEKVAGYEADLYYRDILEMNDYPTALRGEQLYALGRKLAGAPITRFPKFLYEI